MLRRFLLICLLLVMTPSALMAQEDFLVFASENFTMEHPDGWIVSDLVAEQALITATNSPRLVDQLNQVIIDDFQPGEQAMMLFVVPTELLPTIGISTAPDTTPQEFISAVREVVMSSDDGSLTFFEPEIVVFDEREIGIIPFSDSEAFADGYYLAWVADDVTLITLIITYSDELTDFEGVAFDMLASLQIIISADDLNP